MNYPDDNTARKPQVPGPQGPYGPGPQGPYGPGPQGPYGPGPQGPYGAGVLGPYGAPRGAFGGDPYGMQDPKSLTGPYKFTREELHVLKQCNQESFYGRCLPLMAALGLGAYYGVHLGYSKPHPKYGATPKVVLGLIVGFIGGKLSYKKKCEEKILALPGGKLKESILTRRKDGVRSQSSDGLYNDASLSYAMPYVGGNLEQREAKSISELDTDRPYDPYDDSFRSSVDNETEQLPIAPPSRSVTYDELRMKNREEYENRRKLYRTGPLDDYAPYGGSFAPPPAASQDMGSFARPAPPTQPIQSPQAQDAAQYTTPSKLPPQRKNLYGDVVEK